MSNRICVTAPARARPMRDGRWSRHVYLGLFCLAACGIQSEPQDLTAMQSSSLTGFEEDYSPTTLDADFTFDGVVISTCGCDLTQGGMTTPPDASGLTPVLGVPTVATKEEAERVRESWQREVERRQEKRSNPDEGDDRVDERAGGGETAASCTALLPEPRPRAPLRFLGREEAYEVESHALTEGLTNPTAQQLLQRVCSNGPPGVQANAVAETRDHQYGPVRPSYFIELMEVCAPADDEERRFMVLDVYLAGPPEDRNHVARTQRGKIVKWNEVVSDENDPVSVTLWNWLQNQPNGERRMQRLYNTSAHTLWHERQHERHGQQFRLAYETIINTPRYPNEVSVGETENPVAVVQQRIIEDLLVRRGALVTYYLHCTIDAFHGDELAGDSYLTLNRTCACQGTQCDTPLPAFNHDAPYGDDAGSCAYLFFSIW